LLRLRKSTTVFVRTGELMVTRNGRSVVVRHGGLAAGAWDRLRGHLQRGLDISGTSPDSSRALAGSAEDLVLVGCLNRAAALVPDHWWDGTQPSLPGVRDLLEVCYEDPRLALAAVLAAHPEVTGGRAAAIACDLLKRWGVSARCHASRHNDPLHVVIRWRAAHTEPESAGSSTHWVSVAGHGSQVDLRSGSGAVIAPRRRTGDFAASATDMSIQCAAAIAAYAAVRSIAMTATAGEPPAGRRPTDSQVMLPPTGRLPVATATLRPVGDLRAFARWQADPALAMAADQTGIGPAAHQAMSTAPNGSQPRPARAGRAVSPGRHALKDLAFPQGRLDPATASMAEYLARRDELLLAALGWLRFEPGQPFNPHAAYPSPRSVFTSQAWWCDDASCRAWDPSTRRLGGPGATEIAGRASVVLRPVPERLPAYYGGLRWALCLLELGHAAETVAVVGQALGWDTSVEISSSDNPTVAVTLDLLRPPAAEAAVGPDASRPGPPPTWADVLRRRTSGHTWGSLVAVYDRIANQALVDIVNAVTRSWNQRWAGPATGSYLPPDLRLVTGRVDGIADGVHAVSLATADRGGMSLLRRGSLLGGVQRAFRYPREAIDVTSMNLVLVISWDMDQLADRYGDDGLHRSQVQAGGLAQAAGLEASAWGLFCRPCRSFDPVLLSDVIGLPAELTPSYLCLLGRDQVNDLSIDLECE
jgi:hypothetical protein